MGINVQIGSEQGEVLGEVHDPWNLTEHLLPAYSDSNWSCLRFVDRIGDAVFNQMQVPVLLNEIRRRIEALPDRDVRARKHATAILRLIEEFEGRVHTYVRFVGD
jgi:hypothetical protein